MGIFKFDYDQKHTVWYRTTIEVESDNLEEAKKLVLEKIKNEEFENHFEEIEGTLEKMYPKENDNQPTEEILFDTDSIWTNI